MSVKQIWYESVKADVKADVLEQINSAASQLRPSFIRRPAFTQYEWKIIKWLYYPCLRKGRDVLWHAHTFPYLKPSHAIEHAKQVRDAGFTDARLTKDWECNE